MDGNCLRSLYIGCDATKPGDPSPIPSPGDDELSGPGRRVTPKGGAEEYICTYIDINPSFTDDMLA